jgi:hypothetical protein
MEVDESDVHNERMVYVHLRELEKVRKASKVYLNSKENAKKIDVGRHCNERG